MLDQTLHWQRVARQLQPLCHLHTLVVEVVEVVELELEEVEVMGK